MKSPEFNRAIKDLRSFIESFDEVAQNQRIRDLEQEIKSRTRVIAGMETRRSDALIVADLIQGESPTMAYAFGQRAGILLEEIERIRPHSLNRKLLDARQDLQDVKMLKQLLNEWEDKQ